MTKAQGAIIDSYMKWWDDAGYTVAVSDVAAPWLTSIERSQNDKVSPPEMRNTAPAAKNNKQAVAPVRDVSVSPFALSTSMAGLSQLASFDEWLHQTDLPGRVWSDRVILPSGPQNARLMILADVPDVADVESGTLFSGESGQLLDAMLGAIGIARGECRLASIAFTRPVGGLIDDGTAQQLKSIAQRHIALCAPRALLLLGQQACLTMTGQPIPPDGKGQREINHCGAITAAFAANHPRLLIARPQLKRPAWEALKRLKEII